MTERTRWLTLAMVIFSVLALLAFAACGGGDDDDDGGDGSTATPTEDSGDDGGEPTATDDSGDDGGSEDIFSELDEFTNQQGAITGKVTYTTTSADGTTSSYTVYSKPPNSRYDSDNTSIFYTSDQTIVCDSDGQTCFATEGGGSASALLGLTLSPEVISAYVTAAEFAGLDVEKSDESFNGIDATCFAWEEDADTGVDKGKMCFGNDDGIGVYYEFAGDDGTTITEVTDYSSDVSDSDFEPPYDVTTIPTG